MPPRHSKYNKQLPAKEFFALKPGDKYVIYWAKDDDPVNSLRLDFEVQTVDSIEKGEDGMRTIFPTDAGYEWSEDKYVKPDHNVIDTSRGYAHLFRYEP